VTFVYRVTSLRPGRRRTIVRPVSIRQRVGLIAVAAVVVSATLAPSTGASTTAVRCPASVASSAGPVQWLFSALGAPTSRSATVNWSWTRGSGSWSSARASGTICSDDKGGGLATRHLVLRVSGSSTLSPMITELGLLGVGIVLPLSVSASDDAACPRGTPGSVTLFASYYSIHRDSIVMRFAPACASHDHSFGGTIVHVEIARNGHQVNTASA
jgi:hypothetical protein